MKKKNQSETKLHPDLLRCLASLSERQPSSNLTNHATFSLSPLIIKEQIILLGQWRYMIFHASISLWSHSKYVYKFFAKTKLLDSVEMIKLWNHRMVWVTSDLKDHLVPSPAMGSDTFYQARLLKVPSNPALNISRDGPFTDSLGKLSQYLTTFIVKNFLMSNLNLPTSSLMPLPLVLS